MPRHRPVRREVHACDDVAQRVAAKICQANRQVERDRKRQVCGRHVQGAGHRERVARAGRRRGRPRVVGRSAEQTVDIDLLGRKRQAGLGRLSKRDLPGSGRTGGQRVLPDPDAQIVEDRMREIRRRRAGQMPPRRRLVLRDGPVKIPRQGDRALVRYAEPGARAGAVSEHKASVEIGLRHAGGLVRCQLDP